MNVQQIYELTNTITTEVLGKSDIVNEDLSNIVDVGTEIFNASAVDNYVKSLVDHIGKVIFVNRPYSGKIPSVLMDGWEFGSVLEKITSDIPDATENYTWDLVDGNEYKQDIFYKPTVTAKFYNSKVTFEVPMSITERQIFSAFSNVSQYSGFVSMIYDAVDKSMTIKTDALIMRTIDNMIGDTFAADATAFTPSGATEVDYSSTSTNRCVNLLKLYNDSTGTTLTPEAAITTPDFIRYATYIIGLYTDRLASISTLFNVGGKPRFTSSDRLHFIVLSNFARATTSYLQSDTYHNDMVKLPNYETVPFWQASGTDYSFANCSDIDIKTSSGNTIHVAHILGVMFDRDALGVCNLDKRVTSAYNAKAEFFNNYYKFDCGYFNDTNENFVVFYVA